LAQDEGSPVGGFAVLEYETAEQAEEVLREMDRQAIGGSEVRVSFCAPGTAGRSTLAALIAAQGVMANNKKGLLPEPSIAQMLNSMTNPAALQVLMRPYHAATAGKPPGIVGLPQGMPYLRSPPLTAALLQLGKVQQNAMLGNGLVLQNIWRMQLAHQQLVQLKEKQAHHASSLLGDPSRVLLQKAMGMRAAPPVNMGKGLLGDSPNGLSSEAGPTAPQTPGEQAGMMAYMSSRRHLGHAALEQDGGAETQASAMGGSAGTPPGGHSYLQDIPNPMVLAGAQKQQSLPGSNESSSTAGATAAAAYGDYNSYMQAVSQYYSQTHMAQAALQSGYQQRAANKEADMTKAVLGTSLQCASNGSVRSTPQSTAMPAYNSVSLMSGYMVGQPTAASSVTPLQTGRAGLDWGQYYYIKVFTANHLT
ncbi:UNVERIFIED_CONTAM: hypothetical protein FKN15_013396, partial [Acipenser sinensis]